MNKTRVFSIGAFAFIFMDEFFLLFSGNVLGFKPREEWMPGRDRDR